jgi:hypothetical protein
MPTLLDALSFLLLFILGAQTFLNDIVFFKLFSGNPKDQNTKKALHYVNLGFCILFFIILFALNVYTSELRTISLFAIAFEIIAFMVNNYRIKKL